MTIKNLNPNRPGLWSGVSDPKVGLMPNHGRKGLSCLNGTSHCSIFLVGSPPAHSGSNLLRDGELAKEIFGPSTLIVRYTDRSELIALAHALEGQLTATLHGTDADIAIFADLVAILGHKPLSLNGFPTAVEICRAMVHGGPYPATSDSRFTSVGTPAILRFARPV
jgi:NADP-dependent aldehyde dehydrogenase